MNHSDEGSRTWLQLSFTANFCIYKNIRGLKIFNRTVCIANYVEFSFIGPLVLNARYCFQNFSEHCFQYFLFRNNNFNLENMFPKTPRTQFQHYFCAHIKLGTKYKSLPPTVHHDCFNFIHLPALVVSYICYWLHKYWFILCPHSVLCTMHFRYRHLNFFPFQNIIYVGPENDVFALPEVIKEHTLFSVPTQLKEPLVGTAKKIWNGFRGNFLPQKEEPISMMLSCLPLSWTKTVLTTVVSKLISMSFLSMISQTCIKHHETDLTI